LMGSDVKFLQLVLGLGGSLCNYSCSPWFQNYASVFTACYNYHIFYWNNAEFAYVIET
jgi:hypothetical protein